MKNPNSIPHMHFSPSHQCLEELFSIMIRVWLRNTIFYWLKMLQWIVRKKYKERSANMCAFFLSLAHWSTSQVFSIRWKYISFSLHVENRREWKLQKNESIKPTHSLSLALIQSHLLFGILYSTQEFNRYVFYMFLNIVPKKILLENFFLSRFADIIYVRVWQDERIEKRRRWRIRICVMFGWYSLWVIFSDLGTEKYDSSFDVGFFFFLVPELRKTAKKERKWAAQRHCHHPHLYINMKSGNGEIAVRILFLLSFPYKYIYFSSSSSSSHSLSRFYVCFVLFSSLCCLRFCLHVSIFSVGSDDIIAVYSLLCRSITVI